MCSWFKFNNLEEALGMALKCYTSVLKRLKLEVRKFWDLIPMLVGVTAERKNCQGAFLPGGTEFIQNFQKGETYLIGENFVGKKLLLGKIFVT